MDPKSRITELKIGQSRGTAIFPSRNHGLKIPRSRFPGTKKCLSRVTAEPLYPPLVNSVKIYIVELHCIMIRLCIHVMVYIITDAVVVSTFRDKVTVTRVLGKVCVLVCMRAAILYWETEKWEMTRMKNKIREKQLILLVIGGLLDIWSLKPDRICVQKWLLWLHWDQEQPIE